MERLPSFVTKGGESIPRGFIRFEQQEKIFLRKLELQKSIRASARQHPPSADPKDNDQAEALVDPKTKLEKNIPEIQNQSLLSAEAKLKPWSDSYWPTYRGQIAHRYAEGARTFTKNWLSNFQIFQSEPPEQIFNSGNSAKINKLSPAEKYDIVLGDMDFNLTRFSWEKGKKIFDKFTEVPLWMGICHGWSAAAHMGEPLIAKSIIIPSQNGTPLTFFPQDIKALTSMLWANGSPATKFIGGRCDIPNPPRNEKGRILDPNCFDTNPATWHLVVVNQLGKNKRSFVFDATYDEEVWNFPIFSASYRYFNPQTFAESKEWKSATIPLESFTLDKFREFRSANAVHIVGISMDVTYVVETEPRQNRVFDAPTKTVRYIYDLELDSAMNIIGGEWYTNAHPDFIWTHDSTASAQSLFEKELSSDPWAEQDSVPASWTPFAKKASAKGIPLLAFLKRLIEKAGPATQP